MSASSTTSSSSASHSSASSTGPTPLVESPPALTRELLRSYQASHYRLLLWLGLMMSCVLAVFPINDPDIFFSLRTGQLISSGEFPWGSDPYCYAEGEQASWVHNGWLGDWIIYQVYQAGGGPALVLFRVALVAILCLLLMKLAGSQPRFLTVLVITLGFLALGQRLYLRTELFSIVLIGV
ncbi:MAG TPA: hypothetical protein PKA06_02860, partial [Gemmatales bacterium]|nr:hypothetical protein [Gemmatales bacterium]